MHVGAPPGPAHEVDGEAAEGGVRQAYMQHRLSQVLREVRKRSADTKQAESPGRAIYLPTKPPLTGAILRTWPQTSVRDPLSTH